MVIDTKTTAGGVVVLLLSGTGGYLATNAVNGETTKPTTLKATEEKNENKDSERREEIIKNTDSDSSPERQQEGSEEKAIQTKKEKSLTEIMKEKISESNFEDVNEGDGDCKTALENDYNEANFKSAILACFKTKTFKNRANKLSIELIDGSNKNSLFKQRFQDLKEPKLTTFAQKTAATQIPTVSGKTTESSLSPFCEKVGALTWKEVSNNQYTVSDEWNGYLEVCAKDNSTTKDFWTGK